MKRREFLTAAFKFSAAGVLAPEWILDPPKGRAMIAVPEVINVVPFDAAELLEPSLRKVFFKRLAEDVKQFDRVMEGLWSNNLA